MGYCYYCGMWACGRCAKWGAVLLVVVAGCSPGRTGSLADGGALVDGSSADAVALEDVREAAPVDAPVAPGIDAFIVPDADASPVDAPAASPDAPTPPDTSTPEGFARRIVELRCAAWIACSEPGRPACLGVTTFDECVADQEPRVLEYDRVADFHPERVDAFLAELERAYGRCEQLDVHDYCTLYPFYGLGEPAADGDPPETGDACRDHRDCATLYCYPVTGLDGLPHQVCVPPPPPAPARPLCG